MKMMQWGILWSVFAAVFVAELGDKTQLATMLFASDRETSKLLDSRRFAGVDHNVSFRGSRGRRDFPIRE